jgi:hypothetical protein
MQLGLRPVKMLTAFAEASWNYNQAEKPYSFMENTRTINYVPVSYEAVVAHASITYHDTLFFPASVSIWYDYNERPLWERIRTVEDYLSIVQDTLWNATKWHTGGKADYTITVKKFRFELWGNCAVSARKTIQRFMAPLNLGIDAGYGSQDKDALYTGVRIAYRHSTVLRYKNDDTGQMEEFTAPACYPVTAVVKIPVRLPFPMHIPGANIWMEAGPINITQDFISNPNRDNLRVKEHPLGNPIGPAIAVRVDGMIK